jgi:hypothetical protein
MTITFRQFIENSNFSFSMFEQEAVPALGGAPESPANPDNIKTTNKHHFDFLKRQFGIGDEDFADAIEAVPIQVFKVPDYSNKWGFLVIGDCGALATQRDDGNWDVNFMLSQKQLMNPNAFIFPYEKNETPVVYKGKVEDKKEIVTDEELQDMVGGPLAPAPSTPMAGPMGMGAM